jgi:hypothetical protein
MRLPADIHPYLAQQLAQAPATVSPSPSSNDPPSSKYPSVLPAQSFTSESVQNLYRTPVTPEDVAAYRRNPDLLLSQSFLTSDNEYIQVSSMITTGRGETKESLSYVAFADDGPEAYCHPLESLLKLLEGSYILN